jgi:hypothetical protein
MYCYLVAIMMVSTSTACKLCAINHALLGAILFADFFVVVFGSFMAETEITN